MKRRPRSVGLTRRPLEDVICTDGFFMSYTAWRKNIPAS